jgi:protein TonB
MAAPFAPFPKEMEKEIDLLEIIRIWQFRKNSYWETG